MMVFKLLRASEWATFNADAMFAGSPDDIRDGFIHLSTIEQLPGTFAKYFADEADAVVVHLHAEALGLALRWEPSRGGALFPHLYRALSLDEVLAAVSAVDEPLLR